MPSKGSSWSLAGLKTEGGRRVWLHIAQVLQSAVSFVCKTPVSNTASFLPTR